MLSPRVAVEHHAYNTNREFANFSLPPRMRCHSSVALRRERLAVAPESAPASALPSAIAPTIYARSGDIPAAVIVAVATIFVIRRRAPKSVS
jgi:hypothetical protein